MASPTNPDNGSLAGPPHGTTGLEVACKLGHTSPQGGKHSHFCPPALCPHLLNGDSPFRCRDKHFWSTYQVQLGLGHSKVHKKEQTLRATLDAPTAPSHARCSRVLIMARWIEPHLHSPFLLQSREHVSFPLSVTSSIQLPKLTRERKCFLL